MAFDFSTLITDRTLEDVVNKTAKGFYNATDLNRVDACLEDLVARLGRVGCNVPGYERVKIERAVTPSSRLPEGYTEVQYIQSTGMQWIDTGFAQNQNSRFVVDFQLVTAPTGSYEWIFEGCDSGPKNRHGVYATKSNGKWSGGYGATIKNTEIAYNLESRITADFDKNILKIGQTFVTFSVETFQSTTTTALFARKTGGSVGNYSAVKLYSCQIYDNGNLIRDFVPCIDPTGTVGLYDQVERKFYGNAGTGVFLAGPPRATLPEGYTQLEYIQSSGTQYVDTGFRPKNITKVMMDFQVTAQPKSHQIIFGERTSYSGTDQFVLGYTGHNSPAVWRADFGSSQVSFPSTVLWSTRMTAVRNGPDCTLDGTAVKNSSATFSAAHNLFLLSNNDNETAAGHISAKLFFCQIFDGDAFARFLVPCKNAAGAVGLYDVIGGEFYGNAGTGRFTAGPVVTVDTEEPPEELDPYTWYETDTPTFSQLSQYRANVDAVRSALQLPEGTPETPETMRRLTTAEANSIEAILLALNSILSKIHTAVCHCGVTVCGSKGVRA